MVYLMRFWEQAPAGADDTVEGSKICLSDGRKKLALNLSHKSVPEGTQIYTCLEQPHQRLNC